MTYLVIIVVLLTIISVIQHINQTHLYKAFKHNTGVAQEHLNITKESVEVISVEARKLNTCITCTKQLIQLLTKHLHDHPELVTFEKELKILYKQMEDIH